MNFYRSLLAVIPPLVFLSACSSAPTDPNAKTPGGPPPAWTQQPARTSENGYIIYVGNGEDATVERAHFKASGMAIQDLVNECSLAPKGTRTEDSYEQKPDGTHTYKAWVKVSIQFEDCEDAKKATDPEAIRKIANVQLTEELKRYQTMIDEPAPEALAGGDNAGVNPALGNTGGSSYNGGGGVRVVAVNDYNSFFWARQQVAYTKEVVVLAPPTAYQPGTPQTAAFVHQVAPAQASVQQYEAQNPQTKTWNQSYSGSPVRQQMIQQQAASRAASTPQRQFNNRAQGKQRGQGGRHGNGPRRRKRQNH